MTGAPNDRAAVFLHDIGLRIVEDVHGEVGFEIIVGVVIILVMAALVLEGGGCS